MNGELLLQQINDFLHTIGIYELNGCFVIGYWIGAHIIQLTACLELLIMALLDLTEAERTNMSLYGRIPWHKLSTLRYTLLSAVLWLLTAFLISAPVPTLGLFMLLATTLWAWLEPAQRLRHLARGKGVLIMYALAALGLRVYLALDADVYGWAAAFGSVESAIATLQQGRGLVQIVAMLAILYGIPVGYLAWLVQDFVSTPRSLVAPGQTAQQVIHALRTRGGLSE